MRNLGIGGHATDPYIRIRSVDALSTDEARVDVLAFCRHGTPTVKRQAGKWRFAGANGGWAGCGLVPVDRVLSEVRPRK